MARKIEVTEYNPEWPKLFKQEEKLIKQVLGKNCKAVYHIGSTAVKGMKAKPVIDIMPVVKDISLVDQHNAEFEALGYECRGEFGIPGRRFFVKGGDNRTHQIHIFENTNHADIERHLAVKDYLLSHPEDAREYAELKVKLAAEYTYDNDGYCEGKCAFVQDMEQKALKWKKKQEHQSFCMSLGMCFGVAVGYGIGSAFGKGEIGMCFGICMGMCAGLAIGSAKSSERGKNDL